MIERLKAIVVFVVLELEGERMETFGRVVSRVTERLVEPTKLFAVSLTQTLKVYVPSTRLLLL